WADVVGTENICAVPFPEGGDVVTSFLTNIGVETGPQRLPWVNGSPDWTACEALRRINIAYRKAGRVCPPQFRREVEKRFSGGSPPRLTAPHRQAVLDAFRRDHERLIERYFPGNVLPIYPLPHATHETHVEPPVESAILAI